MPLNDSDTAVLGTPGEDVTHWGIMRRTRKNWDRLDHPNADGVRLMLWPLADLSVAEVRRRWGAGEYRVFWMHVDPEAEVRQKAAGNGIPFKLDPVEVEPPEALAPPPVPISAASGDASAAPLDFALRLMQMADARSEAQLRGMAQLVGISPTRPGDIGGAGTSEVSEMRAELAAMRAQMAADARQREIEDRHRAELDRRDREIADLRRQVEDLETDEPSGPTFAPGRLAVGAAWVCCPERRGRKARSGGARHCSDRSEDDGAGRASHGPSARAQGRTRARGGHASAGAPSCAGARGERGAVADWRDVPRSEAAGDGPGRSGARAKAARRGGRGRVVRARVETLSVVGQPDGVVCGVAEVAERGRGGAVAMLVSVGGRRIDVVLTPEEGQALGAQLIACSFTAAGAPPPRVPLPGPQRPAVLA